MNKVLGYRKMIGMTQAQMAKELSISENTYRLKEQGKYAFKQNEIEKFITIVCKVNPNVKVTDIFFEH